MNEKFEVLRDHALERLDAVELEVRRLRRICTVRSSVSLLVEEAKKGTYLSGITAEADFAVKAFWADARDLLV